MLEKLSKSYKIPVDYSGQGSGNFKDQIDTNEVEPMMPIPIEKEKEDK